MTPELLAPARDLHCGKIAVNAGADAVYIGAERFSARQKVGNPISDISRLIEHAHRYDVRVYAAVNTLLSDREIPQALKQIHELYAAGIDALILQDIGLLETDLPPLPLFASTQMHNHQLNRIRFLEAAGFSRAILARELHPEDVRSLRDHTSIALEVFVHGALCVAYSGKCYLSYVRGGRSANRGDCAAPCRKPFRLTDATGRTVNEGHLLSMRDLKRLDVLEAFLDAGATSFKIEGRLKDDLYVANTVAVYRRELDRILTKRGTSAFADHLHIDFTPDLSATFHRSEVKGFARGHEKMADFRTPKMMGTPIGRIQRISNTRLTLDAAARLAPGDGLCFMDPTGQLQGTSVRTLDDRGPVVADATGMRPGLMLYRNRDQRFRSVFQSARISRRVPVWMKVQHTGQQICLTVRDSRNREVTVFRDVQTPDATHVNTRSSRWQVQLSKTGNTEFECIEVTTPTSLPPARIADMNALRREGLAALRRRRETELQKTRQPGTRQPGPLPFAASVEHLSNALSQSLCRRFAIPAPSRAPEFGGQLERYRVMTTKYCLRRELDACLKNPEGSGLIEPLQLVDPLDNTALKLVFDCKECEMQVCLGEQTPAPESTRK
jgi:23S rRNA 5-hydroxycytidine C2501 synthase